jgi:hypothetical protein
MKKLPTTPPPPGYTSGDWEFRLHRVEICYNCEHCFLSAADDESPSRVFFRAHCGECACSSYMMSGDRNKQRCPLNKWPVWSDWEKTLKENDENI